MQTFKTVNPEEFQKLKASADDKPVVMLNLLRYKTVVEETGLPGKAAYSEYLKAAYPFFEKVDAQVLFHGTPEHMLIGPMDEQLWDAVLVVRYGSFSDFKAMTAAEGYPAHLRERALEDSRLIHCKPKN